MSGLTGIGLEVSPLDELHARIDRLAEDPTAVGPPQAVGSGVGIVDGAVGPSGRVQRRVSKRAGQSQSYYARKKALCSPVMQAMPQHPPLDAPLEACRSHCSEDDSERRCGGEGAVRP
jgi:hypothetical protein